MIHVDQLINWGNEKKEKWFCHMWSDSSDNELHEFAKRIGVPRAWFHVSRGMIGRFAHYDLNIPRREKALENGAIEESLRNYVNRILRTKKGP